MQGSTMQTIVSPFENKFLGLDRVLRKIKKAQEVYTRSCETGLPTPKWVLHLLSKKS